MPSADALALTGLPQLNRWNIAAPVGTSVVVTYSFASSQASYDSTPRPGFAPFSAVQENYARQSLQTWGDASGITFIEVPASVGGQVRFGMYDMTGVLNDAGQQASGFAFFPQYSFTTVGGVTTYSPFYNGIGGDVFMNANFYNGNDEGMEPGQRGYSILLHEIGHVLGFKHPFTGTPLIDPSHDSGAYTVMSYNRPNSTTELGIVDVEASQYYYGVSDLATTWDATNLILTRVGTSAGEWVLGTELADHLSGMDGNDTLRGELGNDALTGGAGNDSIVGGDGNDVINATHDDGNDQITGGNGFDILDFSAVNGVVQINQLAGTITGSAGNDTLSDVIEQIKGTNFNDVLSGGHGINVLDGEGGHDQFFGNNGDDLMRGGTGDDTFYFSTSDGNDTLLGGDGFDVLDYSSLLGVVQVNQLAGTTTGTANNDTLSDVFEQVIGTSFSDVLSGGHGINSLKGNGGDDQFFANNGDDYTSGGDGNDAITMGIGNDTHDFRNGEDVDTILDFTAGGTDDTITLTFYSGLGSTSFDAAFQARLSTVSGHAELLLNGGDRIIFNNVASHLSLTAADFIF